MIPHNSEVEKRREAKRAEDRKVEEAVRVAMGLTDWELGEELLNLSGKPHGVDKYMRAALHEEAGLRLRRKYMDEKHPAK